MSNKKNILVVGGCGLIGGLLSNYLHAAGNPVTIFDNLTYEPHFLKPLSFINGDVTDLDALAKAVEGQDVVVFLAGLVGDAASAVDCQKSKEIALAPLKFLANNFKGKLVFTSTCSVYGYQESIVDENASPNPLSLYAELKVQSEELISQKVPNATVLRLGTVHGLGDSFTRPRLDLIVNNQVKTAYISKVISVGSEVQWRPHVSCTDVCRGIQYCIENDVRGLYNFANENLTALEVAQEVRKVVPGTEIVVVGEKFEDNRSYQVQMDKFKSVAPDFEFSQTIKDSILDMYGALKDGRIKDPAAALHYNAAWLSELKNKGEF